MRDCHVCSPNRRASERHGAIRPTCILLTRGLMRSVPGGATVECAAFRIPGVVPSLRVACGAQLRASLLARIGICHERTPTPA